MIVSSLGMQSTLPVLSTGAANTKQRKHNRQRRDYLYRRAQLLKDAEISEKRAQLRASLASGKPLARQDVDEQVRKDYAYDESRADMSKDEAMDLDDEVCRHIPCSFGTIHDG